MHRANKYHKSENLFCSYYVHETNAINLKNQTEIHPNIPGTKFWEYFLGGIKE